MKRRPKKTETQTTDPLIIGGFVLFAAATAFVVLMLTGYTFQLDDIKIAGLYVGGAVCLLAWSLLWLFNKTPLLPKPVLYSYGAYLLACILSTLFAAEFVKWIGWQYVGHYLSVFGFVALGAAIVQNRRMVELSLKFWVTLTFITTLFGLIHYSGLLEQVYAVLYPRGRPPVDDRFHDVLNTFINNRSMLSTILNVQFFGNFLLMLLPVTAALTMLVFRNLRRHLQLVEPTFAPMIWLIISALSVVFSVACIFLTYSKSSIIFLPVVLIGFFVLIYLFAGVRRIPYFWVMVVLTIIMGATLMWFVAGDLRAQFKNVDESLGPRTVIFGGAWSIFIDQPIFGGGPGSFRLLFPEYRSPDYHLLRISNLTLYAHNWLLDLLAETGLLGALAYLAFLGALVWFAYKAIRESTDVLLRVAIIGTGLGVLCILGGAALTPMTRWPVGSVSLHAMMGTFLGISWFTLRDARGEESPIVSKPAPNQTVDMAKYAVAILAAVYLVYITPWANRTFEASRLHNEGMRRTEFVPVPPTGMNQQTIMLFTQGAEYFNKSLELNPASPTTYYKLANAYNRLGNLEKALETYESLLAYAPDYSEVHFNLAVINFNIAMELREEANEARREGDEETLAQIEAKMREHFERMNQQFDIAAEQSNKISVNYYRATTLLTAVDTGVWDPETSKEYYKKVGDIFLRVATLPVSKVIQEEGQVDVEKDQKFKAYAIAVDAYRKAGELALAARAAEDYVQLIPTNVAFIRQAVQYYQAAGEEDEALRVVNTALQQNPLSPNLNQLKFNVLLHAGKEEEARVFGKYLLVLDGELSEEKNPFLTNRLRTQIESGLRQATSSAEEEET